MTCTTRVTGRPIHTVPTLTQTRRNANAGRRKRNAKKLVSFHKFSSRDKKDGKVVNLLLCECGVVICGTVYKTLVI